MTSVGVKCQDSEGTLFFPSIVRSEETSSGLVVINQVQGAALSASCPLYFLASVLFHAREALSVQHVLISWDTEHPSPPHICTKLAQIPANWLNSSG